MISNKLKLNDDKTHLLVMTTRQKIRQKNMNVQIQTQTELIKASETEKLLGAMIHENLTWSEYIQNDKKSLISQLSTRLNALKKISGVASFKTRLMIANGIFISKLIYLMPVWAGCEKYLKKALQIIQNKAARTVTRLPFDTSVKNF